VSPRVAPVAVLVLALLVPFAVQRRSVHDWKESAFLPDPLERRLAALALREAEEEDWTRAIKLLGVLARDREQATRIASVESLVHLARRASELVGAEGDHPAAERAYSALSELGLPEVSAALGG